MKGNYVACIKSDKQNSSYQISYTTGNYSFFNIDPSLPFDVNLPKDESVNLIVEFNDTKDFTVILTRESGKAFINVNIYIESKSLIENIPNSVTGKSKWSNKN